MKKLIVLFPLFMFGFSLLLGQESAAPSPAAGDERLTLETAEKDSAVNKGLVPAKETKPALPAGYDKWIDGVQKEQIYRIQREYNVLIDLLQRRIELLKRERDAKSESVLTPEQLEKVKKQPNRKQGDE